MADSSPLNYTASGSAGVSYLEQYASIAVDEMRRTGVPASITLAQGIIESDHGRSRLARQANNHFGIKCHSNWRGGTIYHNDDRRGECFRRYRRAEDSFRDHSDFLVSGSRYAFLFRLDQADYRGWARGLKEAGYATNPRYASMLIDKIEEMALYEYDHYALNRRASAGLPGISDIRGDTGYNERYIDDRRVNDTYSDSNINNRRESGEFTAVPSLRGPENRVKVNNRINYIIAGEGDTYESVTAEFNLRKWELERYNEFHDTTSVIPGMILYLQPKRARAEVGNDFHTIGPDENLYIVSQKYGVKMDALRKRNSIPDGMEPPAGTELWLRREKPEALIRYYIP
ncbi:MAG: glucosaminidase domain-containing protein [Bacteroidales bacterium]|nr:glucosaminidase domain-containing protein [Bacteroidales bacterium]